MDELALRGNSKLTEKQALALPGEIYRHYKGGIYRLIYRDVKHTETGEICVVYEHLWPYANRVYVRPQGMFFGLVGESEKQRFKRIVKEG